MPTTAIVENAASVPTAKRDLQDFVIVCLVCRRKFGNRYDLAQPTKAKMHKLICRSCIEGKALRRLYRDPTYKAIIIAMWERQKANKLAQRQLQAAGLPAPPVLPAPAASA
jgi:hypothetical protein